MTVTGVSEIDLKDYDILKKKNNKVIIVVWCQHLCLLKMIRYLKEK